MFPYDVHDRHHPELLKHIGPTDPLFVAIHCEWLSKNNPYTPNSQILNTPPMHKTGVSHDKLSIDQRNSKYDQIFDRIYTSQAQTGKSPFYPKISNKNWFIRSIKPQNFNCHNDWLKLRMPYQFYSANQMSQSSSYPIFWSLSLYDSSTKFYLALVIIPKSNQIKISNLMIYDEQAIQHYISKHWSISKNVEQI